MLNCLLLNYSFSFQEPLLPDHGTSSQLVGSTGGTWSVINNRFSQNLINLASFILHPQILKSPVNLQGDLLRGIYIYLVSHVRYRGRGRGKGRGGGGGQS